MKKHQICALLTAVSLLLCGCQKIDNTDLPDDASSQAESMDAAESVPLADDVLTNLVSCEEMTTPENFYGFPLLMKTPDGYLQPRDLSKCTTYDENLTVNGKLDLVPLAPHDGFYLRNTFYATSDDAIYALCTMENHSNMPPYENGQEAYDWDTYNESWESEYYLCTYQYDGTLTDKVKIEGLEAYRDPQGYDRFGGILYADGKCYLALYSGAILRIEPDGSLTETISPQLGEMGDTIFDSFYFLFDRDGKPILYTVEYGTAQDGSSVQSAKMYDFDVETGTVGEPFFQQDAIDYGSGVQPRSGGCGEYRLFVTDEKNQLLGIRDDGTTDVVIDWEASDLNPMPVVPLADGTFVGEKQDAQGGAPSLVRLTRLHKSEIQERQTIRLGVLGINDSVNQFIKDFNWKNKQYRIEKVSYEPTVDEEHGYRYDYDDAKKQLRSDIMNGNAPDVVIMYENHDEFLRLGSRGAFEDLNPMIDTDTDYPRAAFVENVLESLEHPNGSLYAIPNGFMVKTLAVKSKFADKENWTFDDMFELYEGASDRLYYWSTKEQALELILLGTDLTDELNGTCRFDTPEFQKILEFCNRYPAESTEPAKNYEDPEQNAKFEQWIRENFERYMHDEDYLYPMSMGKSSFAAGAYSYARSNLGNEDITLVGFPSDNGQGGKITTGGEIGICTSCQDKAGAWKIVKEFMTMEEYYSEYNNYPILNDAFEEALDDEMYIFDHIEQEDGNWIFGRTDQEYYQDDEKVYPLTQEERDHLETYIRNCKTYMLLDQNVKNIVEEEAEVYFSGDRNAEDTAKMIQQRAELYLSEQQ